MLETSRALEVHGRSLTCTKPVLKAKQVHLVAAVYLRWGFCLDNLMADDAEGMIPGIQRAVRVIGPQL